MRRALLFFVLLLFMSNATFAQKLRIKRQEKLEVVQGESITISLSDLDVEADRELNYPAGFYLIISEGNNYSVSGNTITVFSTFSGNLKVTIRVSNGSRTSDPFDLRIKVKKRNADDGDDDDDDDDSDDDDERNQAPVILSQVPVQIQKNSSYTIQLSDLEVSDPDNSYPADFTLKVEGGPNYTLNGASVTPAQNFVGMLTVKLKVNDGKADSNPFSFNIKVLDDDKSSETRNQPPTILNQVKAEIRKNDSFTIQLSHLVVSDQDNNFPADFSLVVEPGTNYSVNGTTVKPSADFVGILTVKVKVNDGEKDSEPYNFKIQVVETAPANIPPVITGHSSLTIFRNESLTLKVNDLVVTDLDNPYPAGFTLTVLAGSNYSFSGNTITPAANYIGPLVVKVKVNDGTSDSNVFDVRVVVVEKGQLQILGQSTIKIPEDSSYEFTLSDFRVSDPTGTFPNGFSISVLPGNNYAASGLRVQPIKNFFGTLTVPVAIRKGSTISNYDATIIVLPVNDPPAFEKFDESSLSVTGRGTNVLVAPEAKTIDVDDERLQFAEIRMESISTVASLSYNSTEKIRGIFEQETGTLILLGDASLEEYDNAIRNVTFSTSDSTKNANSLIFRLNDGKDYSQSYRRRIVNDGLEIDILVPTGFTPNNDGANDTWVITMLSQTENTVAELRIYNDLGTLLFESDSLSQPWNGIFNGEVLPAGSYFYTLIVTDSNRRARRNGVVTILR